jgi:hypothetical protein
LTPTTTQWAFVLTYVLLNITFLEKTKISTQFNRERSAKAWEAGKF